MSAPRVEFVDRKGRVWRLALLAVIVIVLAARPQGLFPKVRT